VRHDCDAAAIEALFDPPESGLGTETLGVNADDDLLISRQIPHAGKGRVFVNGSPSTVALLSGLGARLIHLRHAQH
jgi:DNA repair ATPase RecN